MTNSMMISRKLVMTSAKSNKSSYHITKNWSLMSRFNHTTMVELKCDNLAERIVYVGE